MQRLILLLIIVLSLTGCASLATAPAKEDLAKFDNAYIVRLEDFPLGVDPISIKNNPNAFYYIPWTGSLDAIRAAGVINSILAISVLAQLPQLLKQEEVISKALQEILNAKEVWRPSAQLANIAAIKIRANGVPVKIAEKPLQLDKFTNKDANAWYNNNGSATNYEDLPLEKSPYILEIAVFNGISANSLMLEVRMKLIDPASGLVLGRTREWKNAGLPGLDQAFKDNGRIYKEIYLSSGQKLIQKSLSYLGLINDE